MSFRSDSITGSLFGTASWAITSSAAIFVEPYPWTGSAEITGSLRLDNSLVLPGEGVYAYLSATQSHNGTSTTFLTFFPPFVQTGSAVTHSAASAPIFTLPQGGVYFVQFFAGTIAWSTLNGYATASICNISNYGLIGDVNVMGTLTPVASTTTASYNPNPMALIRTATSSVNFLVKISSGSGLFNIDPVTSYLKIERVG